MPPGPTPTPTPTGYTYWDIGACNCAAFCPATPCNIPQRNLAAACHNTNTGNTGTGTIAYLGGCKWGGCVTLGPGAESFYMMIDASGATPCYRLVRFANSNCSGGALTGGTCFGNPLNCASTPGSPCATDTAGLQIHAVSCSPYDVIFGFGGLSPPYVLQIELT